MISIYGKNQIYNNYLEINKNAILTADFQRLYITLIQQNPFRLNDIMPVLQIISS